MELVVDLGFKSLLVDFLILVTVLRTSVRWWSSPKTLLAILYPLENRKETLAGSCSPIILIISWNW